MLLGAFTVRATPLGFRRCSISPPRVARRSLRSRRSTLGWHRSAPSGRVSRSGSGLSLPLEETVKLGKEGE